MSEHPVRLLFLEDNPADAELNARLLQRAGMVFVSRRVETRADFLAALADFQPEAILADFGLPQFDGLTALRLVRERDPDWPFIFVTGALGEESAVELLRNGANDYILKDRPTRLPDALQRALETARQRQALRRAEQELRESEARFHALFEHMRSGVCIYEAIDEGRDFIIRDLNHSVEHIEGLEASALLGRRLTEALPGVVAGGVLDVFQRVWRSGRAEHLPPHHYQDARIQGWREHFIYRLPHGELVAVYDDVTERRTLELALEASRERLELALEGAELGMWDWQLASGRIQCNDRWAAILGYRLAELEPLTIETWRTLCHPADRALSDERLARHLRGEVPCYDCELRMRHQDGHWVWVLNRGKVVEWGADHQPLRMAGTHLDISTLKHTEAELNSYRVHLEELVETRTHELRLAEEHSRLLLESSADGLYGVDIQGHTTFVNPAACAMLGYRPEQLLGRSIHELIHYQHADGRPYLMEDCPLNQTLTHGEIRRGDDELFWRADGTALPVAYSSHPIRREGEIVGAVVSFIDSSTQKQAEAAREAALVEAERLARLKSEFLANMSHEIRTPLNAVLGFAQIGVRETDPNKIRVFFQRILDSGQLLLGIINDILDFSKIEADKLDITDTAVDLRALIERSVDLFSTRAAEKGLHFHVNEGPELPASFLGDDLRLSQILANLLSNAIKFTNQGAVTLSIQRDDGWISFSVEDTGIGMREDYLANLFRPFEQADGSITRRYGGSGLGLAISKRLVELMGGEIHAWSRFGEGTRFETRLPLIEPQGVIGPRRLAAESYPVEPCAPVGARLRGLRLLAAEDNLANRLVLEEMLGTEGADLTLVEDGRQAVECVEREGPTAFDLVLMDIQMPVMDGLEATQRIHQFAPRLPVVGLTAHALNTERHLCLQAGMVDHIAKPVEVEALIAMIVRHACPTTAPSTAVVAAAALPDAAVTDAPIPAATPTTTWIDWQALETRYAHNPDFIPRLLQAVLESNQDQAAVLRETAQQGDRDRLVFIAHRLKGTAGNLFANRLHQLATETETCARALDLAAPRLALELAEALDGLLTEINASHWLRTTAAVSNTCAMPASSLTAADVTAILDQLAALLAADDTESNRFFAAHQALLQQTFGARVNRLEAEIKQFDYQAAREVLRGLKSN